MKSSTIYPKRLIEVDLPIKRISAHARREKSIRHGHISTLHIWWARRPLAACRAVICASLWPDPADPLCPESFIAAARKGMLDWTSHEKQQLLSPESQKRFNAARKKPVLFDDRTELRKALLDFIADFANWDNSTIREYLDTSRALTQAAHEALGGVPGTRPLVVDPFAGGGSIPLEALRIGADAFASDLNPVPVLLNNVVLEYIPKYGQRLADEVRKWGEWIKREAEKELVDFYPKDTDGATPIAYLWARTILCEGPGCGAQIPLVRSLWLAKKGSRTAALQLVPNKKSKCIEIKIIVKRNGGWINQDDPKEKILHPNFEGTVKRGSATCLCCGYTSPAASVRQQVANQCGGSDTATLLTVLVDDPVNGRHFRQAAAHDFEPLRRAGSAIKKLKALKHTRSSLSPIPNEELPYLSGIFNVHLIGITNWGRLFTARQQLALSVISKKIYDITRQLKSAGHSEDLSKAIQECLALVFGKVADRCNAFARWEPNVQCSQQLYGRQALGIVWDFGELAPLRDCAGSWGSLLEVWLSGLYHLTHSYLDREDAGHATVARVDATKHTLPDDCSQLIFTDPPYYDAVPYADLSDFFYVWLKRMLNVTEPNLFSDELTPKLDEIVQLSERNPKYASKTKSNFENKMQQALAESRRVAIPSGIAVIVFAHKATSAWEAMLQAVIDAGWIVVGSWPIDTEMETRLRALNSATLSSSIHLVCRPRENSDGSVRTKEIGDWRDVLEELPRRIHSWMPRLADEGVVGADAIFACLGPALEIFSRYSRVEKANGEIVTLKEYLEQVWAAVAKEALSVIFSSASAEGFEPEARLIAMWLWTLSAGIQGQEAEDNGNDDLADEEKSSSKAKPAGFNLEYDAARKIAQGLGVNLEALGHLVEIDGSTARLLSVSERAKYLFGESEDEDVQSNKRKKKSNQQELFLLGNEEEKSKSDNNDTAFKPGATVLDRVHQSMLLFGAGRSGALKRLLVDDGAGADARFWRLAQALSALYPSFTDEKRWIDGVLARKKGLGF